MLPKKSLIETIAGSPGTELMATAVPVIATAVSGSGDISAIASFIPVLTNTLAKQRLDQRVNAELTRINDQLSKITDDVKNISDNQFNIILKTIQSILETNNKEKLKYLNRVITNSIKMEDLASQEAVVLSRIIRDISAQELEFIVKNYSYERVHITDHDESDSKTLRIKSNSPDSLIVSGLESIGVLIFSIATMGGGNILQFSKITAKLIMLIKEKN